ncbi:hypothetical protein QL104_20705 [Pseudomonas piscis]|uniref:Uncharacterized protein n=1 Tax=Pseudomonas piscis TaxID=2614538 RepID=A0ABY9NB70_9PSED|nr:hypothetical protein [Pseudomonas piscis]WMN15774.1 hypothetical protein QL104_20705 [Pseudomonas piscis]
MRSITVTELVCLHLQDATLKHSSLFGLERFSAAELAAKGYERVGDPRDFHLYEKNCATRNHQRTLEVGFKCYFRDRQLVGSGFSLSPGARLTSMLKYRKRLAARDNIPPSQLAFYFSGDKKEGAVILDDRHVMRFNQWSHQGAYLIATLESDLDLSNPLGRTSTKAVKMTLEHHSLESMRDGARNPRYPAAFRQLAKALHDASI